MDLGRVGLAYQSVSIKLAFALGVLRSKNMALERFSALDLAGRGFLEAFGGAFVRFQFGHNLHSAVSIQLSAKAKNQ
jgi:hypothetical protein